MELIQQHVSGVTTHDTEALLEHECVETRASTTAARETGVFATKRMPKGTVFGWFKMKLPGETIVEQFPQDVAKNMNRGACSSYADIVKTVNVQVCWTHPNVADMKCGTETYMYKTARDVLAGEELKCYYGPENMI